MMSSINCVFFLALIHHPDRHASATDEEKKEEEKKFKEVGEAYTVLSDAAKKSRYDNGQDLEDMEMPGETRLVFPLTIKLMQISFQNLTRIKCSVNSFPSLTTPVEAAMVVEITSASISAKHALTSVNQQTKFFFTSLGFRCLMVTII
jgi:curved DNA-binding protein CbpA